jgi:hypothetical protein
MKVGFVISWSILMLIVAISAAENPRPPTMPDPWFSELLLFL